MLFRSGVGLRTVFGATKVSGFCQGRGRSAAGAALSDSEEEQGGPGRPSAAAGLGCGVLACRRTWGLRLLAGKTPPIWAECAALRWPGSSLFSGGAPGCTVEQLGPRPEPTASDGRGSTARIESGVEMLARDAHQRQSCWRANGLILAQCRIELRALLKTATPALRGVEIAFVWRYRRRSSAYIQSFEAKSRPGDRAPQGPRSRVTAQGGVVCTRSQRHSNLDRVLFAHRL